MDLFDQVNHSQKQVTLTIATQTIAPSHQTFFIAYDIGDDAESANSVGLKIGDRGWIGLVAPNDMDPTLNVNVSRGVPNGSGTQNFPFETIKVPVVTNKVIVGVFDAAALVTNKTVSRAQADVVMVRFNTKISGTPATWQKLTVEKTGSAANNDIKFVKIYRDANPNDELDSLDELVSGAKTTLTSPNQLGVATSSPAFIVGVQDATLFPQTGYLWVGGQELMRYSRDGASSSTLRIDSRGERLGVSDTPRVAHATGTTIEKVDIFDQNNDSLNTVTLTLAKTQSVNSIPQVYFLIYDVADFATAGRNMGAKFASKGSFVINAPNEVDETLFVNVSQSLPGGTASQSYPYESTKLSVSGVVLSVTGFTIAPSYATPRQKDMPLLRINLKTSSSFTDIGQVKLTQLGTVQSAAAGSNVGKGDLTKLSVWIDSNGDKAFTSTFDKKIGEVTQGTTNFLTDTGQAVITLAEGGNSYLRVTNSETTLFIVGEVGLKDSSGASVIGHQAGVRLAVFEDILGIDGNTVNALVSSLSGERPPLSSNLVTFTEIVTPVVNPRIVKIMLASDGYPALVKLSSSVPGFVSFGEANVPLDQNGNPILAADLQTQAADGVPGNITLGGERLIDLNGDGVPDNLDLAGTGRRDQIDLDGDGKPELDIDGDGILDSDFNGDGFPDEVVIDSTTLQTVIFVRYRASNGSIQKVPVADAGFVKVSWSNNASELYISWTPSTVTATALNYSVAVGESFNELDKISKSYLNGDYVSQNARKITSLSLQPAAVVRLDNELSVVTSTGTQFTVDKTIPSEFPDTGRIYVGMELMQVRKAGTRTFEIISRGANDSLPQFHPKGTPVSDTGYTVALKVSSGPAAVIASQKPLILYRIDTQAPSAPGSLKGSGQESSAPGLLPFGARGAFGAASFAPSGIFPISWTPAADDHSGVAQYEIQERVGNSPVWKTIGFIPAKTADGALVSNYTVGGDPRTPAESPRAKSKFFSYRVRAFDAAGSPSSWSGASAPVFTGSLADLDTISGVSNYPNPFDSRKEKTTITYLLKQDSEVTIRIYDLFGFRVKEMSFPAGTPGGTFGANNVEWDGTDGSGHKVSKGGYVADIQVKGDKVISVQRKIGVIH